MDDAYAVGESPTALQKVIVDWVVEVSNQIGYGPRAFNGRSLLVSIISWCENLKTQLSNKKYVFNPVYSSSHKYALWKVGV